MPYPVYSARFLSISGSTAMWTYFVPAGKVAVVKSVAVATWTTTTTSAWCSIRGVGILYVSVPAQPATAAYQMHQVAYAGEAIEGSCSALGMGLTVSGFLLTAVEGPEAPIAEVTQGPLPAHLETAWAELQRGPSSPA